MSPRDTSCDERPTATPIGERLRRSVYEFFIGNRPGASPALARPGYPAVLAMEPTSVCNLHCQMCGLPSGRTASSQDPGPMSPHIFARAADAAERVGLVCFNGFGEGFTDPHFLTRLEDLDRRGIRTVFSTNATLVRPEHAARLARLTSFVSLNVSLDSADPEMYRSVRGQDQSLALRGLDALSNEARLLPKITVSAIVCEKSLPGLSALPELLARYHIHCLILQGLSPPADRNASRPQAVGTQLQAAIDDICKSCGPLGIHVEVPPYLSWQARGNTPAIWKERPVQLAEDEAKLDRRLPSTRQCNSPWELAWIDKDGRVFPCCLAPEWREEGLVGDLRTQTFEEVWTGEPFRNFRLSLLAGDVPAICKLCPVTSTGPHFFTMYAAQLLPDTRRPREDSFRLAVKNAGAGKWTRKTNLRIGTTRWRDRPSPLQCASWLNDHRAGTFIERVVSPGAQATFVVDIPAEQPVDGETFQLLVEGICWLPGTEFGLERCDGLLSVRPLRSGREPAR